MGMQTSNKKTRGLFNEINVTPFVDVMLVLLVIFMVTAPMLQQSFDIELPETKNVGVSVKENPFILKINKNKKLYIEKTLIPQSQISKKISAILKGRKEKQVYIQVDKTVNYGFVAKTMAKIKAAGIYKIGLITNSN